MSASIELNIGQDDHDALTNKARLIVADATTSAKQRLLGLRTCCQGNESFVCKCGLGGGVWETRNRLLHFQEASGDDNDHQELVLKVIRNHWTECLSKSMADIATESHHETPPSTGERQRCPCCCCCCQKGVRRRTEVVDECADSIVQGKFEEEEGLNPLARPVQISVDIPAAVFRNHPVRCQLEEPVFLERAQKWRSTLYLFPDEGVVQTKGEEEEQKTGQEVADRPSGTGDVGMVLPAVDFRQRKDMKPASPGSPNWEELERLEEEAWNEMAASPLVRQNSYVNYMRLITGSLTRFKKDLKKLEKQSDKHYKEVATHMSKEKLQEFAHNRLLRKDITNEINFLEDQIKTRELVFERDNEGHLHRKSLIDRNTSKDRFARATRTIAEMIEVLENQLREVLTISKGPITHDDIPESEEKVSERLV